MEALEKKYIGIVQIGVGCQNYLLYKSQVIYPYNNIRWLAFLNSLLNSSFSVTYHSSASKP